MDTDARDLAKSTESRKFVVNFIHGACEANEQTRPGSGNRLTDAVKEIKHVLGVFFFNRENLLHHPTRGRVTVAQPGDDF